MLATADTVPEVLIVQAGAERRLRAVVDVTIPVHNEEAVLEASVRRLHGYLTERFPLPWLMTVADNASTDQSWGIACRLASELDGVQAVRLAQKGRGRSLRASWSASTAPVVAYMDVDLSTDLDAFLPLVAPLISGHSDIAIGTRLASSSLVRRGPRREAISRTYNLLLRTTLRSGFSDAQCGFKAVRTEVAKALLPLIEDDGWFFDTELLVLAEQNGLRIHEVPVDWIDDPDSRVDVVDTAKGDLRGIWRMLRRVAQGNVSLPGSLRSRERPDTDRLGGQLVRFGSIGIVSTIVFALLFALLARPLGPSAADVVALGLCALANTAANRRVTFALRGPTDRVRHYGAGIALAGLPLLMTLAVLALLDRIGIDSITALLAVTSLVNGTASLGRFVVLRRWMAPPPASPPQPVWQFAERSEPALRNGHQAADHD